MRRLSWEVHDRVVEVGGESVGNDCVEEDVDGTLVAHEKLTRC